VFGFLSHILKRAGLVGFHHKNTAAEEFKVPDICEQQTKSNLTNIAELHSVSLTFATANY
jgi:hypothetical protein